MSHHRRMKCLQYRSQVWEDRYAPHVQPINKLIEQLRQEGRTEMPYVASSYGGVNAKILFLFQDPGPGTDRSQFLCIENDDPSADRFARCMDAAGLSVDKILGWNSYPWVRPDRRSGLSTAELDAGMDPLIRLLELLKDLKVIALMGRGGAQQFWDRFEKQYPAVAKRYHVLRGPHPSNRGIRDGNRQTTEEGEEQIRRLMLNALDHIQSISEEERSPRFLEHLYSQILKTLR